MFYEPDIDVNIEILEPFIFIQKKWNKYSSLESTKISFLVKMEEIVLMWVVIMS